MMKYLLDTHTFLWFINDDPSLSPSARSQIEERENVVYLSVASIWEMAIKVSLHKLEMPSPFGEFIDTQLEENTIILLNINTAHTGIVTTLPFHHRDPFDRLMIAQAKVEDIIVIGNDAIFDQYGIKRLW